MIINGRFAKHKRPAGDNMFDIGFFNWHICRQEIERLIKEKIKKYNSYLRVQLTELKLVADSAHETAQWTLDANRRQVTHILELTSKIEAANKILADILELIECAPIEKEEALKKIHEKVENIQLILITRKEEDKPK